MRLSSIKYDPTLSIEQIAENSGVSENAVREYIKKRRIDRKYDENLIKYRQVNKYMFNHPGTRLPQVAYALGLSINTVRKYAAMTSPPQLSKGKRSALEDSKNELFVAVAESQPLILRAILSNHLAGALTFQCDLTTGKGDFYKGCVPIPDFLYDINPQLEGVKPLESAVNLPDDFFESVVIDLPCSIVKPTVRRQRTTFASFDSLDNLYAEYTKMIKLAARLLRSGGILVFKTADFRLAGQQVWISDWSIQTAINCGFTLADKYIYIDRSAIDAVTTSARKSNTPTHAYFLVFKKNCE